MKARPYRSVDLPRIIEIYCSSIQTLAAPYYSAEQISAWARMPADDSAHWQARLAQRHTIVAETDGVLAGFASYAPDCYLDFLFTHPAFARRGVASKLYLCVESTLITAGVPKVTAHVSLAARQFFEHHGFRVDAEEHVECRGVYLRRFSMYKNFGTKYASGQTRGAERPPA